MALELDLPLETVDTIDKDHSQTKDKCYHMFNTWLQRMPDASWCSFTEALKMVKMLSVANDIETYLGKQFVV